MPQAPTGEKLHWSFFQRPPWNRRLFWYFLAAVLLYADHLCGLIFLFPILFIFPVILAGWNCARRDAILIAIALCSARIGFGFFWATGMPMLADVINAVVWCAVLIILGVVVSRVAEQNALLARRLTRLEGLLPICSHCRKILDEDKHWTALETYVVEHSQAQFSHGVCPECAKLHYGLTPPDENVF
ncbi:MAG: hypothetical protein H0T83_03350 [Chthoniobacterales bacterium]|nr:hypothetical protein [Chthoniobacterales bacterium]